jgi:hypothetical protein
MQERKGVFTTEGTEDTEERNPRAGPLRLRVNRKRRCQVVIARTWGTTVLCPYQGKKPRSTGKSACATKLRKPKSRKADPSRCSG